ncbi:sn-glycerol-3-phosphate import ATP-binding protein UgpC [Folsomia candida]|uniref:sn-glycerol-3-phosphate import ATP-binding protein UgpC n=1 Tax=Folsomia candida TaxID=158441 RepID=UPI001604A1CF|nr:sn-glycerol-3-phosphate import ATP-binding protein UgpC [Folsomia candida]
MAVTIRNGFKRYGNGGLVLKDFDMTVGIGEIYGLLGSSGCGKTTVLSCIVGLRQLDSGSVAVFNQPCPNNQVRLWGYMPQEVALLDSLSVEETLKYFGMLYAMDKIQINERINFLTTFLELPIINQPINELSGGQKRRVSLAAAMIHNPKLLVLDEPSVGLDPLLRQSIWKYLHVICSKFGTSIIISTHYAEEIRLCHKVPVNSYEEGQIQIQQGETTGLIEFPENYVTHFKNRMAFGNFVDNGTILGSTISIRLDEANLVLAIWLKKTIMDKYLAYVGNALAACSLNSHISQPPLLFHPVYGSTDVFDYITFMQIIFFISMGITHIRVEDQVAGLEDRDYICGVYLWHQLIAAFATQSLMTLIQIGSFLGIMCGLYGMVMNGSWLTLVGLMFMSSFAGLSVAARRFTRGGGGVSFLGGVGGGGATISAAGSSKLKEVDRLERIPTVSVKF